MKQQANLIRAGQVIEHEGRRWTVLKQQIITPGKGGAFIQVEMRDLKSGKLSVLLLALSVAVLSLTAVGLFTSRI